jgi:hypothetical protein
VVRIAWFSKLGSVGRDFFAILTLSDKRLIETYLLKTGFSSFPCTYDRCLEPVLMIQQSYNGRDRNHTYFFFGLMVSDGNKNPIIFITLMILSLNEVYIRNNYYKSKERLFLLLHRIKYLIVI